MILRDTTYRIIDKVTIRRPRWEHQQKNHIALKLKTRKHLLSSTNTNILLLQQFRNHNSRHGG